MERKILIALALSAVVACGVPSPGSAETHEGTKADNTKVNKEARGEKGATADQQTEKDADRKMTQQIRRAVVKNKSLSVYGHNVKIITRDGEVTLKGPVRSEKEKKTIEGLAAKVAGKGKVTSELEVKPKE